MARQSPPIYWTKNAAYLAGLPAFAGLMCALATREKTDRERLDVAKKFRFRGYSLKPYQIDSEILGLLDELHAIRANRVVEIGTARGGTLFLLLRSFASGTHIVSVDLHHGEFGGGYPHWKIPLFHSLALGGPKLTLLRGSSQTVEMRERVRAALGGAADFILIDGDHSYEGAKRDFEIYQHLISPGGIIAFHDIVPGRDDKVGGVPRLWKELRETRRHKELVHDWGQGGFGIGLLYF